MANLRLTGVITVTTAIALIAVWAGSASATELCKEVKESCSAESVVAEGSTVSASLKSGTKSAFKIGESTLTCEGSTIEGKTTSKEDVPLSLSITSLSFSGCLFSGIKCTLKAVNTPYGGSLFAGASGSGTLYVGEREEKSGYPGQEVACSFLLKCTVTTPEAELSFGGGKPATITAKEVELVSETKAGAKALWTAEYELTAPNSGQAAAARATNNSILCKVNENNCSNRFLSGQKLKGPQMQAITVWLRPAGVIMTCPTGKIDAKTEQEVGANSPLNVELVSVKFFNCVSGTTTCTAEVIEVPYTQTGLTALTTTLGSGGWQIHIRMEVKCPAGTVENCKYEKTIGLKFEGASPAKVKAQDIRIDRKPGGTDCQDAAVWNGRYELSEEPGVTPLYLTN